MIEIERKNVNPRFTLSQTRAVLKIAPDARPEHVEALTRACEYIVPRARETLRHTCRGRVSFAQNGFYIDLRYGSESGERFAAYKFDLQGNPTTENLLTPRTGLPK